MSNFFNALIEGAQHIFCLDALDHILFLLVLCACYDIYRIRKVFWLVTAFTLGHAVAFVLAALELTPSVRWLAEFLIPITIMLTALINWSRPENKLNTKVKNQFFTYVLIFIFGSVHGMAMGDMILMNLNPGENYISNLIGFNIGVELAQIIVVFIILISQLLILALFRIKISTWKTVVSGVGFGAALVILLNQL